MGASPGTPWNRGTATVDVLDASSLRIVAIIAATGQNQFAASDGRGKIYFSVEHKGEIDVIDIAINKLVAI